MKRQRAYYQRRKEGRTSFRIDVPPGLPVTLAKAGHLPLAALDDTHLLARHLGDLLERLSCDLVTPSQPDD